MKKRFLSLIGLLLCVLMLAAVAPSAAIAEETNATRYLEINKKNFPDANFRNWIIDNLEHNGSSSGGYYMTKTQVENVTSMNLKDNGITNAKGVERFTKLQRLVLWNNQVKSVDLSKNTELTYLDLDNNQLTKLDLTQNTKLQTLYCSGNQLAYLRLVKNTEFTSSSIGAQSIENKKGAVTGGKYLFDLSKLIPTNLLKYVTLSDSSHKLNKTTGVVTLSGKVNYFSYTFNTGRDNKTMSVTIYITDYTEISKPTITTQPTVGTKYVGQKATLKVAVSGGQLTYQWQYRTTSSGSWKNVTAAGGTTKTYSFTVKAKHNGYQYRCVVKNMAGKATTKAVTLKVNKAPKIYTQPKSASVAVGATAKFTVKSYGSGLKYQWYYRTSKTGKWIAATASSAKTAAYSFTAKAKQNGYQIRCKVRNSYGTVYSKTVTLSVGKPIITTQPVTKTVALGSTAEFAVTVRGSGLKYQWYYRTSSAGTWKKVSLSNATSYKLTTSVLAVKATKSNHGYQYRCVITNSLGKATSKTVTMWVKDAPRITTQPKNYTGYIGDTVKFTVKASGSNLKYQWYYRTSSTGTWTKLSAASATTATYKLKTKATHNGYQYKCVISNTKGKITSKIVSLKLTKAAVNYRALLIGEVNFGWDTATRNRGDVVNMKSMLGTVKGPEGTKYSITTKYDLGYNEVKSAIKSAFSGSTTADVCLFFIATHGNSSGDGELALSDGTSLDFATLASWLSTYVKGEAVVILESCGAGSAIYKNGTGSDFDPEKFVQKAVEAFAAEETRSAENAGVGGMRKSKFYVLAAAAHHQMSWGHESSPAGNYFTDWLIEGIGSSGHMPADTNKNNIVTLKELYTYISKYNDVVFHSSDGTSGSQQVQVYPENSAYKLFKR